MVRRWPPLPKDVMVGGGVRRSGRERGEGRAPGRYAAGPTTANDPALVGCVWMHYAPPCSLPGGRSRISSAGHNTAVREGPRNRPHKRVGSSRASRKSRLLARCEWPLRQHASPGLAIHSFLTVLTFSVRAHGMWTMVLQYCASARGGKCCETFHIRWGPPRSSTQRCARGHFIFIFARVGI